MRRLFLALCASLAVSLAWAGPPVAPSAPSVTLRAGPIVACVGDSECAYSAYSVPITATYYTSSGPATGTYSNALLGWLQMASGGALALDFVNDAYPGNYLGLKYVSFVTQGSGCPANATVNITPSTPTGPPVNTPATLSFTTDSYGNTPPAGTILYESVGVNQGSGYIATPTFSLSQTCTTPPTFGWALTGVGAFGVSSEQSAAWLIRVQNEVCAARPDWAVIMMGTNDLANGVSEAALNANILAGLQIMERCGIRPVLVGVDPRIIGVSGWTQSLDRARLRVNAWRRNLATLTQQGAVASTNGLSTYPGLPYPVLYVDPDHYWNDPTQSGTTAGNAIANMTIDGLHESSLGSFALSVAIWAVMKPYVQTVNRFMPNTQNDVYDAINNPAGNLLGAAGIFIGATGAATAPCTTSAGVATGWTLSETGNASMSCVGTLETTRSDGLSGTRQVVTISDAGGTVSDTVTVTDTTSFVANITAGDQIYLEGDIDLSNLSQVGGFGCYFSEVNASNQKTLSTATPAPTSYNSTYPSLSSAVIAKWSEAQNLPDFGLTAAGSFRAHVRTPPITVQAGDTGTYTFCQIYLNGSTGTATATEKLSNFAIRKVNAN